MANKICSKCETLFHCACEAPGCWCETIFIDMGTLSELKKQYDNCLCPTCLNKYEIKQEKEIII